jgi:hypothetical protein
MASASEVVDDKLYNGRYKKMEILGKGGFGTVFKVEDKNDELEPL